MRPARSGFLLFFFLFFLSFFFFQSGRHAGEQTYISVPVKQGVDIIYWHQYRGRCTRRYQCRAVRGPVPVSLDGPALSSALKLVVRPQTGGEGDRFSTPSWILCVNSGTTVSDRILSRVVDVHLSHELRGLSLLNLYGKMPLKKPLMCRLGESRTSRSFFTEPLWQNASEKTL